MKARISAAVLIAATTFSMLATARGADSTKNTDSLNIKQAVPADAFLAIYVRHNPQRDYQRAYFAEAWKTFHDEQICTRLMNLVTSHMPPDKVNVAKDKLQELQTAAGPINLQALINAKEMVIAERMNGPFNNVLWAVRLNPEDATDCERGLAQLFDLFAKWSNGKITVATDQVNDCTVKMLAFAKESPFQPAVARINDIVLVSTHPDFLRQSIEQLASKSATSKFDDPRLQSALAQLHQPDDSLVFFDGKKLFQDVRGIGDFIRAKANNDPKAIRAAEVLDHVIDETGIVDYVVTSEYTEPGRNRAMTLIKMADGYENKLLGRAMADSNKPLENWQSWVAKDATAYSVHRGLNFHVLYDGIIKFAREQFPESQPSLDKFDQYQDIAGVNLDHDILQSFTGESVCVTMPVTMADGSSRQVSVTALKCNNPDKVRELLHRAVAALNQIPAIQMQQLKLEDCAKLEGFQEVHASFFAMFGSQPVIGFRDGWMTISSCPEGAEKLLNVHAGKVDALDVPATFAKFGIDPKPALCDVSYKDIGGTVRSIADGIDKVGAMAPMFLGMAAANAKPEELKPVQEAIGILPSIAKVVRKFDFYDHSLSVTRPGTTPSTYLQESATEIKPPKGS